TVINSDVMAALRQLPSDHFGVVVTSPPYWGLRDYGVAGQLGLEPTLGEHLDRMVEVFAEVHRVLKPDGVCWANYGDCYATTPNGRSAADTKQAGGDDRTFRDKPFSTVQGVMKPKDLCMVPNRFAIAMQDWGWWVRSEIIWAKPNPMPESVIDRPATAHEKVFMFTKAARYFYDADEVRQGRKTDADGKMPDGWDTGPGAHGSRHRQGREKGAKSDKQRGHSRRHAGFNDRWDQMDRDEQQQNGRNLRNYEPAPVQVWEIATRPFRESHFATFPPELVARCLRASLRPADAVLDPFGGAGTTGLVADKFGVDCTLVEINPEYCGLIRARLASGLVELDQPAVPLARAGNRDDARQAVLI
ncbi:MAG: hypothetical protein RL268_2785, partial [Pseudomonadota bacterium]